MRREIISIGCRVIACVSFRDPRDGRRLLTTYVGETRRVALTNAPADPARYGISNVLVGPDSEVVDNYEGRVAGPNDVYLVIFPQTQVREP